jgi:hypothetical protein
MTKDYHLTPEQAATLLDDLIESKTISAKGDDLNNITVIINAALDEVLGEQWLPIETVPVNKSVLMLRLGKYGRCGIADGYKKENGILVWPYINKEPTHWMPLPNAPMELT